MVTPFGLAVGQLDAILLAATLSAMVLAWRKHWLAAGLVMGLFWLKPDLLWPAILLLAVGIWPDRRALCRYAIGLASSSGVLIATDFPRLLDWVRTLFGFQHGQGLKGLLGEAVSELHLPAHLHSAAFLAIAGVAVLAVSALVRWLVRSARWSDLNQRDRILWAVALGLAVWLALTPYSFPNDDLLMLPLLAAMLGADAARARELLVALAVLAMAVVQPLDVLTASLLNPPALALVVIAGRYAFSRPESTRPEPPTRATTGSQPVFGGAKPTL